MSSSSSSTSSSSTSSSSTSLVIPSLKHFWYTLRDNQGVPRGGELVTVYVYVEPDTNDDVVLAELYNEVGLPISNPVTTLTDAPTAALGVFEFYLKDEMWNNVSPSGYEWDDRIKLVWDNEGDEKSADRVMTWGDFHPIYDVPFDPHDWSQITDPTGDADVNDKNKAISNSLAYQIECHIAKELEDDLESSSSRSSSSSSSTSSSSSSLSSSSSSSSTSSSSSSSSSVSSSSSSSSTSSSSTSSSSSSSSSSNSSSSSSSSSSVSSSSASYEPYENLLTFTPQVSAGDVTITPLSAGFDAMRRDSKSYLVKDFGVDYFTSFLVEFEFKYQDVELNDPFEGGENILIAVDNEIRSFSDSPGNHGIYFKGWTPGGFASLAYSLNDENGLIENYFPFAGNTSPLYYCTLSRSIISAGASDVKLDIFSDPSRTTLVKSLDGSGSPNSSDDTHYRYIYAIQGRNSGNYPAVSATGFTQKFQVFSSSSSSVSFSSSSESSSSSSESSSSVSSSSVSFSSSSESSSSSSEVPTTIGNFGIGSNISGQSAGAAAAILVQFPSNSNVVSIHAYGDFGWNGGGEGVKGVIWDSSGDVVAVTPETTGNVNPVWHTMTFSSPVAVTGSVNYYIGIVEELDDVFIEFNNGNTYNGYLDDSNSFASPESIGSPAGSDKLAIYATYEPA